MTAHNLHHHDHAGIVDMRILIDLHHGSGNVFGSRGVAGAVIRAKQVVINGLGHAHHAAVVAYRLHIGADFMAGIHGIVAAVIEKVADIMPLEYLKNPPIVCIVLFGICDLIAAGTQRGRGCILHQAQLFGILQTHIKQTVIQHAFNAVLGAQHLCDSPGFQSCINDAVCAGIDDRGGTAGLADDAGTLQFIHVSYLHK